MCLLSENKATDRPGRLLLALWSTVKAFQFAAKLSNMPVVYSTFSCEEVVCFCVEENYTLLW